MAEYDFRNMPDEMWQILEPLFEVYKRVRSGGTPPLPFRQILDGIIYKLKTGCQWAMIPKVYGSKSTLHSWFRRWAPDGVIGKVSQVLMERYASEVGYGSNFQSMDGSLVQAPVRSKKSAEEGLGANPTDRGRSGTKIHLHVDENGVPFGICVVGANVHDSRLIEPTITDSLINGGYYQESIRVPAPALCLDKGYDSERVRNEVRSYRLEPHIRSRGEERIEKKDRDYQPRRWVVERSFSWMKGFRTLRTRYCHKLSSYLSFLHLAIAIIIFRKLLFTRTDVV